VFFLEVGKTGTHYIRKIVGKLAKEQKVSYSKCSSVDNYLNVFVFCCEARGKLIFVVVL